MTKDWFLYVDACDDDHIAMEEMIFEGYMAGGLSYEEAVGLREILVNTKNQGK